ncbi:MAG TPA: hypothetical protein VL020_02070, partial [Pseudomonadales bacterium]|nr:hypothetical protein [Pseudomonadales bacterium]
GKTSWGPITHSVNVQDGFVLMFTTPQGSSQDFSALFTPGEDPRPITAMACLVSDLNACSGAVSLNPTGPAYAPTVWFNDTADANGFCLAELATTVETVDPEGILLIEEETDGIETWLKVFDKNGRLEPVTSPRCVNSNI